MVHHHEKCSISINVIGLPSIVFGSLSLVIYKSSSKSDEKMITVRTSSFAKVSMVSFEIPLSVR